MFFSFLTFSLSWIINLFLVLPKSSLPEIKKIRALIKKSAKSKTSICLNHLIKYKLVERFNFNQYQIIQVTVNFVRLNLKYKILLYQSISIDNNLKVLFFYFGKYLISIILWLKILIFIVLYTIWPFNLYIYECFFLLYFINFELE